MFASLRIYRRIARFWCRAKAINARSQLKKINKSANLLSAYPFDVP